MKEQNNNRINNILKDLHSQDEQVILTAIKQLRKHGNNSIINPVIALLNTSISDEVKSAVIELLYDIKDQNTVEDIMLCIQDNNYIGIKPILISIFWQSKLDASSYISPLVNEAIYGDYLTAIEVMTVIDNIEEATFNEEEIMNLKYDIDEYLLNEDNLEKAKLLEVIKLSLDNLTLEF